MTDPSPDDRLFDIILYLVTCARLSVDEPVIYGSFRLIEGASRLIDVAEGLPGFEPDSFLREQRENIEREKSRTVDDQDGYQAWLTDLATRFALERVRRHLGGK